MPVTQGVLTTQPGVTPPTTSSTQPESIKATPQGELATSDVTLRQIHDDFLRLIAELRETRRAICAAVPYPFKDPEDASV